MNGEPATTALNLVVCPPNLHIDEDNPFDSLSQHLFENRVLAFERLNDRSLGQSWNTLIADLSSPTSRFWSTRACVEQTAQSFGLHPRSLQVALEVSLRGMQVEQELDRDQSGAISRACAAALVVLAGNVPALVPQILLPALIARRPLIFKLPDASAPFHRAVLAHLIALEPSLQHVLAAASWDSTESSGRFERQLQAARPALDPVLVYGGKAAVESYEQRFANRTFHAFGPKFSAALVFDDGQQDPRWPHQIARDIALFEQQGCLSVASVLLVSPEPALIERRASQLAASLEELTTSLPLPRSPANAVAARHWLDGEILAGRTVAGDLSTGGAVVVTDAFQPAPGARTVTLVPCDNLETAIDTIEQLQSRSQSIQGLSLAGVPPQAAAAIGSQLATIGIERIAPAGSLQATDLSWRNGGIDLTEALAP